MTECRTTPVKLCGEFVKTNKEGTYMIGCLHPKPSKTILRVTDPVITTENVTKFRHEDGKLSSPSQMLRHPRVVGGVEHPSCFTAEKRADASYFVIVRSEVQRKIRKMRVALDKEGR